MGDGSFCCCSFVFVFCFVLVRFLFCFLFVGWLVGGGFLVTQHFNLSIFGPLVVQRAEKLRKKRKKKGKKLLLLDKYNNRLFKASHFLKARGVYSVLNTQTHEHKREPTCMHSLPPPPLPLKWKRKLAGQIRYCANISICCFVLLCHLYLYAQPLPDVVSHYSVSHHVCWRYWTV